MQTGMIIHWASVLFVTSVGAVLFDWALHFQTQMFRGISRHGEKPKKYTLGPRIKIFLMITYVLLINIAIAHQNTSNVLMISAISAFVCYALVAFYFSDTQMSKGE